MPANETILWGGRGSGDALPKARLRDGIVLREAGPWTPGLLALLRHLEGAGFDAAPRVLSDGLSEDGRETLSFVEAESPHPRAWDESSVACIGQILADLHEATTSFRVPPDVEWHSSFLRALPGDDIVIGHGDTGPWNWIAREGTPVALVDWEFAGPVDRMWELAQATWLNAQLHDDDIAQRQGLPPLEVRARQARAILDGYGLDMQRRAGFVYRMIEVAVQSARAEALAHKVEPESTRAVSDSGFPILWGITWRARSAAWMLSHRRELESTIE
jgi:hypothetical protein